jgi:hypothetical protein
MHPWYTATTETRNIAGYSLVTSQSSIFSPPESDLLSLGLRRSRIPRSL